VNRLAEETTISDIIGYEEPSFIREITFTDKNGKEVTTQVAVKYKSMEIHPPIGKADHYQSLNLLFINVRELGNPKGRDPINWNLISNILTNSDHKIWEMVNWYKQRWTIEIFFKVLKTICKAEESKLRTADRLARLIAILCVMSWRIHWLTMLARQTTTSTLKIAFSEQEIHLLDLIVSDGRKKSSAHIVQYYFIKLAKLGGYLARANDPPPGPLVIWRGLMKLNDIQRGASLCR